MSMEELSAIGVIDGLPQSFDAASGNLGVYWRSEQAIVKPASYEAHTPAGLHIGCGTASITTQSSGLGSFAFKGAGLTAMLCPSGAMPFLTHVSGRSAHACGLFLATNELWSSENDALQEIAAALERGSPLRATSSIPFGVVFRLSAPVDPWFQGVARNLVFQARSIELSAFALAWLTGRTADPKATLRHQRYAYLARDILEQRLTDPPSIEGLARQVGINARSLTGTFRAVFGSSIAAYVTRRRLELAVELLEQGLTPSEVANRVGYSPSHLSNAIQRRFGMRPRDIRHEA